MTTIPLGAINKKTGEYVYPRIANKIDEYSCPECHKDLIICQGNIRVHHFRHKIDAINPCHHYSNPTESQIHKDAKILLKTLLEKNVNISFIRNCPTCKNDDEFEIPPITESSSIQLEHRFDYNGLKIADVAYIDNGEILCIFEIYHTHKTDKENRPEPWFEIDALSIINIANTTQSNTLKIKCIRNKKCDECIKNYTCNGYGECLLQTNYENNYIKNKDFICSYNCKPKKCDTLYCNNIRPQWVLNCTSGICHNCDMGIEPLRHIFLIVPFSQKNEVKRYGAKFCNYYKKWFIMSDNKNKDHLLKKFKEWICNY